jgi:hypothetical protein
MNNSVKLRAQISTSLHVTGKSAKRSSWAALALYPLQENRVKMTNRVTSIIRRGSNANCRQEPKLSETKRRNVVSCVLLENGTRTILALPAAERDGVWGVGGGTTTFNHI